VHTWLARQRALSWPAATISASSTRRRHPLRPTHTLRVRIARNLSYPHRPRLSQPSPTPPDTHAPDAPRPADPRGIHRYSWSADDGLNRKGFPTDETLHAFSGTRSLVQFLPGCVWTSRGDGLDCIVIVQGDKLCLPISNATSAVCSDVTRTSRHLPRGTMGRFPWSFLRAIHEDPEPSPHRAPYYRLCRPAGYTAHGARQRTGPRAGAACLSVSYLSPPGRRGSSARRSGSLRPQPGRGEQLSDRARRRTSHVARCTTRRSSCRLCFPTHGLRWCRRWILIVIRRRVLIRTCGLGCARCSCSRRCAWWLSVMVACPLRLYGRSAWPCGSGGGPSVQAVA
jgi:hypothetical protein